MTLTYLLGDESSSDTITTEGGDPIFLFSLGSTHAVEYALDVDWDGDSAYNGDNEADYLLRFDISRGRERLIGAPGQGFEPYRVGRAVFELDNSSGRFNPWNAEGDLYGNIEPGKLMTFRAAVYSTDGDGHITYDIFTGFVSDIQPEGWNKTVNIVCEDGLGMLDREFNMYGSTFPHITDVLDEFMTLSNYPYTGDFSTDDPSTDYLGALAYVFDNTYIEELLNISSASLGSFACEGDGMLAYHSIYESDTSILSLDDALVLDDPFIPTPWEFIRDTIKIKASKIIRYTFKVILRYLNFYEVPALSTAILWASYFTENQLSDGTYTYNYNLYLDDTNAPIIDTIRVLTGTDSTSPAVASTNYSYSIENFIETAKFEITNSTTDSIYVRDIYYAAGTPYAVGLNEEDKKYGYEININGSTSNYWDECEFNVAGPFNTVAYQKNATQLKSEPTIASAQQNRIAKLGNLLYNYLSTPRYHPTLQMQGRPSYQWLLDVEKKITYTSAQLGIDEDFRVCGLRHQTNGENPQDVLTTIYLYPVIPSST